MAQHKLQNTAESRKHNEMFHTAGIHKIIQGVDLMGYTMLPGIKAGHIQDIW